MKLEEILEVKGRRIYSVHPQDSVLDAVNKLVNLNIGALIVVDKDGQPVGIITERDILRLTGKQPANLAALTVEAHMTRDLVTADCLATIKDSLAVMTERRIRHLPVTREGKLDGMVSQGDLVKARLDDAQFEARQLTHFVMGKYPG